MTLNKKLTAAMTALTVAACCGASMPATVYAEKAVPLDFALAAPAEVDLGAKNATTGTETVTLTIDTTSNPGVQSWELLIGYDTSALVYNDIDLTNSIFPSVSAGEKNGVITVIAFENADVTETGKALSVTFTLKKGLTSSSSINAFTLARVDDDSQYFNFNDDDVPCTVSVDSVPLSITCDKDKAHAVNAKVTLAGSKSTNGVQLDVTDEKGKLVASAVSVNANTAVGSLPDGKYTLTASKEGYAPRSYDLTIDGSDVSLNVEINLFGDLTSDGVINLLDYSVLRQYILGWNVAVPYFDVLDVKKDGAINPLDMALMRQYLLGWDVVFGVSE